MKADFKKSLQILNLLKLTFRKFHEETLPVRMCVCACVLNVFLLFLSKI